MQIIPSPGETPGHQILHIQTPDEDVYFAGDLFHHPLEFAYPDINVYWADAGLMRSSKESLMKRASRSGARVYFTHIAGVYQVKKDRQGWSWHEVSEMTDG